MLIWGAVRVGSTRFGLSRTDLPLTDGRAETQLPQAVAQDLPRGRRSYESARAMKTSARRAASSWSRADFSASPAAAAAPAAVRKERRLMSAVPLKQKDHPPWASSSRLSPVVTSRRPVHCEYDSASQSAAAAGLAFQARRPSTPQPREIGARTSGRIRCR